MRDTTTFFSLVYTGGHLCVFLVAKNQQNNLHSPRKSRSDADGRECVVVYRPYRTQFNSLVRDDDADLLQRVECSVCVIY